MIFTIEVTTLYAVYVVVFSVAVSLLAAAVGLPGAFIMKWARHLPLSDAATRRVEVAGIVTTFIPQLYLLLGAVAALVFAIKAFAAQYPGVHTWIIYSVVWIVFTACTEKMAALDPRNNIHLLLSAGLIWSVRASELAFWLFVAFPALMTPWAWLSDVS